MSSREIADEKAKRIIEARLQSAIDEVNASYVPGIFNKIAVAKIVHRHHGELQSELSKTYVDTLGHKLDKRAVLDAMSKASDEFCDRFSKHPFTRSDYVESYVELIRDERGKIKESIPSELQIAIHDAKKVAPGFWKDKKYEFWMVLISSFISFMLGIAGTLVTLWLTNRLKLQK